ncbi:MAG: hypothetical protein KBT34_10690 [Prevotella sp.]|nr:hypothetical protein [Candidatus Prevotella equi]
MKIYTIRKRDVNEKRTRTDYMYEVYTDKQSAIDAAAELLYEQRKGLEDMTFIGTLDTYTPMLSKRAQEVYSIKLHSNKDLSTWIEWMVFEHETK